MKLPNGGRADLGTKLEAYTLNPQHRDGRHKARVFDAVLGITLANADVLRQALLDAAAYSDQVEPRGDNGFGEAYVGVPGAGYTAERVGEEREKFFPQEQERDGYNCEALTEGGWRDIHQN